MKDNRTITLLGIVFILLWISQIPYLFPLPFKPHQGTKDFSKELAEAPEFIKEGAGIARNNQTEIETIVTRMVQVLWFKSLFFVVVGIGSGILIIKKKWLGYFLALGLSLYLVGMRLYYIFSSDYWRDILSIKYFTIRFENFPVKTIHEEITFLTLLVIIVLLLKLAIAKSISQLIKRRF